VLAFARTRKQGLFYGLFSTNVTPADNKTAAQLVPFAMDLGTGPAVDGGVYFSVGEFSP